MIYIATSGYSYEDWRGPYYPPDLDKSEMLSFYSRDFPFTEVNSTFYRMPNRYMFLRMTKKVPEDFQFAVKAHRSFTHEGNITEENTKTFKDALIPLLEQEKLIGILAQFPYSFKPSRENRVNLVRLKERFAPIPLFVEFRNRAWISYETHDLLAEHGIGYVCVDEPAFRSLVPPVIWATSRIGYVRFHGRNAAKWWKHKEAHERYDYLYTREELMEWVPRIRKLEQATDRVYVAMNNHYRGQAVINAQLLKELLS